MPVHRRASRRARPTLSCARLLLGILGTVLGGGACTPAVDPSSGAVPASAPAPIVTAGTIVDQLPVVDAMIGETPVSLLLDTGASVTCLHRSAMVRIGRIAVGMGQLGGVGDTTHAVQTFGAMAVTVGGVATQVPSVHACPELSLLGGNVRRVDGVLGSDALRALTLLVDYPAGAIRVLPRRTSGEPLTGMPLPVTFVGGLPVISLAIWGNGAPVPLSLLLDTGADASVLIPSGDSASLDLDADLLQPPIDRRGLGGAFVTRMQHAPRARLGTLDIRELPVEIADAGLEQLFAQGIRGVAGAEFLQHFRLELDFGNSRIGLSTFFPQRSLCASPSGICVAERPSRGGYSVDAVRPRSAAARNNLTPGEIIVQVGTMPTAQMRARELRAALRSTNDLIMLHVLDTFGRRRRVEFRLLE